MVTPEQAARDFNKWLAARHASGAGSHFNHAKLATYLDDFRRQNYRHLSASEVPEVHEIAKAVRSLWGVKAQATRKRKRDGAAKRAAEEAARQAEEHQQQKLPF